MEKVEEFPANREHKDRLFKVVFSKKEALLNLYNAVNGTEYDNPEDIEINTIEDFLYMTMKNDVSFLFTETMNLYEHQSTVNPNIPFRGLIYLAKLYQKTVFDKADFYGSKLVKIPTPQFVVFYNGCKDEPDKKILKLSEAFSGEGKYRPALECEATVLNINYKHNKELMDKCKELRDYAILIDKIRRNQAKGLSLNDAIDVAIDECINEGVMRDVLTNHRQEAKEMLFTEYDEKKHIKNEKKISFEDGIDIMSSLYNKLEELNRLDDYGRAMKDPEYRKLLLDEIFPDRDKFDDMI
ncbi:MULTISPECIES: hypothetical protein [Butyrivibrio]|jgi:hypothetical protein|uniref:hypothetical protein n=1 Tax=Butyrivibrio TaxID=830 RepID=UPI0004037E60|nr:MULTISPECIES: hypothetical protein [Butyrivibrio]SEP55234.1 hypothetical protein SAMN02910382_00185 [Butyrivibrio sp. TB]